MRMGFQNHAAIQALKSKAREQRLPLYGAFELTGRCNLNCKMCYVHVMDARAAKKQELSTQQWKKIMDDAYDAGMLFALLTGGECLLRPDFKELYLHLYNKGVIMSVNTNGVLLDEDMVKFFAEHPPEWVQLSLYGSSEDGYEAVTETRTFSKATRAIELLKKYHVIFRIAVTLSKVIQPDFEDIMKFILANDLDYRVHSDLLEPRDDIERDDCSLSIEERLALLTRKRIIEGKSVIPLTEQEIPPPCGSCTELSYGMPCNAGTVRFVASWSGKMLPCMSIPDISIDMLSNDFPSCWSYIREKMDQVVRPIECSGCAYEEKCTNCPSIRYDGLYSGHCVPQVCKYTQAKYAAGLLSL